MKIFLGTDILEIARIEKAYKKFGDKFLAKTYTEKEIEYCLSSEFKIAERLAVRFATKEAVSKALGVGINKLGWAKGINLKDVELVRNEFGAVTLNLSGIAKQLETQNNLDRWEVSVAHSDTHALATVIGYRE